MFIEPDSECIQVIQHSNFFFALFLLFNFWERFRLNPGFCDVMKHCNRHRLHPKTRLRPTSRSFRRTGAELSHHFPNIHHKQLDFVFFNKNVNFTLGFREK